MVKFKDGFFDGGFVDLIDMNQGKIYISVKTNVNRSYNNTIVRYSIESNSTEIYKSDIIKPSCLGYRGSDLYVLSNNKIIKINTITDEVEDFSTTVHGEFVIYENFMYVQTRTGANTGSIAKIDLVDNPGQIVEPNWKVNYVGSMDVSDDGFIYIANGASSSNTNYIYSININTKETITFTIILNGLGYLSVNGDKLYVSYLKTANNISAIAELDINSGGILNIDWYVLYPDTPITGLYTDDTGKMYIYLNSGDSMLVSVSGNMSLVPPINLTSSQFSTVNQYAVFTPDTLTVTGNVEIGNGFYHGNNVVGTILPGKPPNGSNRTLSSVVLNQLITLKARARSILNRLPINPFVGEIDTTFLPKQLNIASDVSFTDNVLTFIGKKTDYFYIKANSLTLMNTTFKFQGGMTEKNIIWYIVDSFKATNTAISGIVLSSSIELNFSLPIQYRLNSQNSGVDIQLNVKLLSSGPITLTNSTMNTLSINSINDYGTESVVCYAKGTLIATENGFVPIEKMKAGDKIITKGKIHKNTFINNEEMKIEPALWISKFKVIHLNTDSRPICIKKNAIGKNQPFKDLYVSPNHNLLLNEKMVSAKKLVNGTTIFQDMDCEHVEYYHLECEKHSAIIANGVLSESYLDINNRDVFDNSIRLKTRGPKAKRNLALINHQ